MIQNLSITYELYAVCFGIQPRKRRLNFLPTDEHDGDMPMNYYVWLARNENSVILIDTGFNSKAASTRDRGWQRCPIEALSNLGIRPEDVTDVVITHLHYDHAGNLDLLPNAKFHIQESEMSYATGPCMCSRILRFAYTADDIKQLVSHVYDDRVVFHSGDTVLFPGIELLHVGGHTKGLQCVKVFTERGWVVIASDAIHFYENYHKQNPFPIVESVSKAALAFKKIRTEVESDAYLIPGHDPSVLDRYPYLNSDCTYIALLHEPEEIAIK